MLQKLSQARKNYVDLDFIIALIWMISSNDELVNFFFLLFLNSINSTHKMLAIFSVVVHALIMSKWDMGIHRVWLMRNVSFGGHSLWGISNKRWFTLFNIPFQCKQGQLLAQFTIYDTPSPSIFYSPPLPHYQIMSVPACALMSSYVLINLSEISTISYQDT